MEYIGLLECAHEGWVVDYGPIEDYQVMLKWKEDKEKSNDSFACIIVPISDDFLFTEKNVIDACQGGYDNGFKVATCEEPQFLLQEFIDNIKKPKTIPEETVPITLGQIKRTCGWSKYCDVTGSNHYMLKEWTVSDREIFDVKISHAKKLNLI